MSLEIRLLTAFNVLNHSLMHKSYDSIMFAPSAILSDMMNTTSQETATGEITSLDGVVWVDPERMGGQPCFYGTRVPIKILFDYIEGGEPLDEFLEGFPDVTREQALAVLEAAKTHLLHKFAA